MRTVCRVLAGVSLACLIALFGAAQAMAQTMPNSPLVDESNLPDNQKSATEVNKELSNPISSIWALQLQENTFFIHPGIEDKSSRNAVNVQFQPVLPLSLTDDWNLITRPVFQVVNSVPVPTPTGRILSGYRFRGHNPGDSSFAESEIGGTVAPWRRSYLHLSHRDHDKCRPEKVAARAGRSSWVPG